MAEEQSMSVEIIEALKLIVSGGFGAAIFGIIGKLIVDRKLQNQKAEYDKQLESLKTKFQLDAQKQVIEYTSLHDKQAQIIADFYERLSDLYMSIQRLMGKYKLREMKEEVEKEYPGFPSNKQIGLTADEQQAIDQVKECNEKLFEFYRKNKIYLSHSICELTDRFCTLASYMEMNYHNVTFKIDGRLVVNPKVKEVWDQAIETIPILLIQLEEQFRGILGVKS